MCGQWACGTHLPSDTLALVLYTGRQLSFLRRLSCALPAAKLILRLHKLRPAKTVLAESAATG